MRQRLVMVLVVLAMVFGFGTAWADDEESGGDEAPAAAAEAPAAADDDKPDHPPTGEPQHAAEPAEPHEQAPAQADHDEPAAGGAKDSDGDGMSDVEEAKQAAAKADEDGDEDEVPYNKFDLDGDGKSDPALEKEWQETLEGYSGVLDEDALDAALDARPEDAELTPSISVADFQKIVRLIKKVVLAKMETKMAKSSAKKMAKFSLGIFIFSLLGFGLLAMPLVLRKKYPGKGKLLLKYSGLAALTFFVTVNLFGGVLFGMKTAQGALGALTNPSLAIASATFDTLDENAEDYVVMGKELFVPTLMQLEGNTDEQPSVLLLQNGMKVVEDAKVFLAIAKMFKKINFVFSVLPIVLFAVTMLLFGLAIRPTLTEIIKLPIRAASGEAGVGRETTKRAMKRVWGETLATLCTLGVLTVLTIISAAILGQIVKPALDALLGYFSLALNYLQFVEGASSGIVFLTLFSVVLFLALNLAALILSMSFFLGKCQKIFQGRFNEGIPVATHKRFFKWGIPAVVFVQLFPLLFVLVAEFALDKINESLLSGIKDADAVPWAKIMLAGPIFLVVAFAALFWLARGFKAMGFIFSYQVKPKAARRVPSQPAEPV